MKAFNVQVTHTSTNNEYLYLACTPFSITMNTDIPSTVKHIIMRKITCCSGSIVTTADIIPYPANCLVLGRKRGQMKAFGCRFSQCIVCKSKHNTCKVTTHLPTIKPDGALRRKTALLLTSWRLGAYK